MDSILTTIKKMLGLAEDYDAFDTDIIVLINGAIFKLMQLGVGPTPGFRIIDKSETWDQFITDGRTDLEAVKSYIYMDVRLIFDAPTPHYVAQAMTDQVKELGWRLNVQAEGGPNFGTV